MADLEHGIADAIAAGCEHARRLGSLLEDEFKALSTQDLPGFESLQASKEQTLAALADLVQRLTAAVGVPHAPAGLADASQWDDFQLLISNCREAHRRNDILIRARLEAIRSTLLVLQSSESSSSVEVYDRLGKMSGYRRGRGYEEV